MDLKYAQQRAAAWPILELLSFCFLSSVSVEDEDQLDDLFNFLNTELALRDRPRGASSLFTISVEGWTSDFSLVATALRRFVVESPSVIEVLLELEVLWLNQSFRLDSASEELEKLEDLIGPSFNAFICSGVFLCKSKEVQ